MVIKRKQVLLGLLAALGPLVASHAEQIVISEIMYHPRGDQPEYIEVYNNTATPFDIAQWRLAGGADYEFPRFDPANPPASFLKPFERIVLSGSDEPTTRATYGIPASIRIFGPWVGNLGNDGERITLKDKNGVPACTVQYNDRGKWSPAADGAGHSLVLKSPNRSVDDWRNWTVSTRPGGTPGTEPIAAAETPVTNPEVNLSSGITIVNYGDTWKYQDQAIDLGNAWIDPNYDDSLWAEGLGLFGFETAPLPAPGIRTPFRDFDQLTYYLRKSFVYNGSLQNAVVTIDQILDDGAVYYLNGKPIGWSGVLNGSSGFAVNANRTVTEATEELNVFPVNASILVNGLNTLAVEVHQSGTNSTDVVFGMRLKIAVPAQSPSGVIINEVLPGPPGMGFVEFYNPNSSSVNLNGFYLTDNAADLTRFRIAGDFIIPVGGLASLGFEESSLSFANPVTVYLVAPNGTTIENGINATIPPDGRSLGRKPTGGASWFLFTESTRNAPNVSQDSLAGLLKLNELHFSSSNTVDWVELFNTSNTSVPSDGLYLAARRDFTDKLALTGQLSARDRASWNVAFPLDNGEVTIYLINAANTVLDSRVFTQVIGRNSLQAYPDGASDWYWSPADTRNAANNPPRNTDVVINEIMFDPPSDQLDGEFIELYNRGSAAVDVSGWRFADGPSFTIPAGTRIPAGAYLVCAANAARLRAVYGNIPVVGDFQGRLSNQGELIRLVDPFDNLVDEVDYRFGGDWPEHTQGNGSSMELVNPSLDNNLPSAWRDSNESNKGQFKTYTVTDTYRQMNPLGGVTDYKELHFHLAGDGYVILQNIALRQNGTGPNLIVNGTVQSTNGSSATGWLCQGTHWASFVTNGQLHVISDGHGDNRANRAEIDITNIAANASVTLSFEARWVWGTPRLIAQTWDHSVGSATRLEVPENLGTPGAANSRLQAAPPPQIDKLAHRPAVPRSTEDVKVTARVTAFSPVSSVQLFHRIDNVNANGAWTSKPMYDDGVTGGDAVSGDGIYTATLTEHKVNGRVVQFYARATAQNGQSDQLPRQGPGRPAMYAVDDRVVLRDLRTERFVVSAYDLDAIANGGVPKFNYRFPRLSNHYYGMTFISNEDEVFYGGEIRNSGSPWTRGGDLSRGKWKLPADRRFRGHEKFFYDNDPTAGRMHHNRITRYWLYLLGHPVNENEFVRVIINSGSAGIREDTEPLGNDLLDRLFENGSSGELYRIDDEWWFRDNWERNNRNADWSFKQSSENSVRYHSEWMKRTLEDDYDFSALINLFRTVSAPATYTQAQIERIVDAEATLKMAAVRGYIQDWDSFTLDRGKNGYLYRRWSDGKFMFMHWDSDLAFGNATGPLFNSGRPGIGPYITKPYNLRRFYSYLAELLGSYTLNSPRMDAWLQAEEDANSSFAVASSFYRGWFSSRLATCRNAMGTNYLRPLEITTNAGQPISTAENTIALSGLAPYTAFSVEVEGHPEAVLTWNNQSTWTISGILLRNGVNALGVRGLDQWGNLVHQASITVNKAGSTPPVMSLKADPDSWNVAVEESLQLDVRDSRDPEGTPLTYRWTPPAGLANFDTNLLGRATANFLRPGLYAFAVQGTDAEGQQSVLTREASVYGSDGFSAFSGVRLETFWNFRRVDYRWNFPASAWLSLSDVPGQLVLQVLDDSAKALTDAAADYPFVWRTLPSGSDWVLQTKLKLASRQFGTYLTGLQIETAESGTTNRYVFGMENGSLLSVKRVDASGGLTALTSVGFDAEEKVIRIRRNGGNLIFEQRTNEMWAAVLTQPLAAGALTDRGGLFLATGLAQSIRVHFDYAMLIDPSNTSELRENLRISEIMYNPVGGDNFEYVELINIGTGPIDLTGARFTNGITFAFGPTILPANARIVVVKDLASFASRYATNGLNLAAGTFGGRLDNGGERLILVDGSGNIILSFAYGDSGDWPNRADGYGSSLEIIDPRGDYDDPDNWNSSQEYVGSPGMPSLGPFPSVVINEVLTHTDPPIEDAVELYNPTTNALDISGWYLSDDGAVLKKFRVPANTTLQPHGYVVFYEYQLNAPANGTNGFTFDSAHGDEVWLTAADASGNLTFFIDKVDFGASENGVSFGRYPNGIGPLVTLSRRTFGSDSPGSLAEFRTGPGATNATPKVGPVVINQVMYNPVPGGDEFIELFNLTAEDVTLYDTAHPTNTWKLNDAVEYVFPANAILTANARLLVVPTDPVAFRAKYNVPLDVPVFGPWVGALDNNGESIELYKPDPPQTLPPDAGFVPYVLVDRVRYNNREPWPTLADGLGPALQRRVPANFGNDPANWFTDFDADGIADDWEVAYLFSPFYAGDADLDFDADGRSNRQEYLNGSDPRNAEALLQIFAPRRESDSFMFDFTASANQSYRVQHAADLDSGSWITLMDVAPEPVPRSVPVTVPLTGNGATGFYRVITP